MDGSLTTLQLEGTPITGHDEANVNFFMLVAVAPSPKLTPTVSGGSIHISFPTQNGYSYQLQYKKVWPTQIGLHWAAWSLATAPFSQSMIRRRLEATDSIECKSNDC